MTEYERDWYLGAETDRDWQLSIMGDKPFLFSLGRDKSKVGRQVNRDQSHPVYFIEHPYSPVSSIISARFENIMGFLYV